MIRWQINRIKHSLASYTVQVYQVNFQVNKASTIPAELNSNPRNKLLLLWVSF
ncbi:hypothetical protein [Acinetobacter sp. TGL-Y2]|uniref:hypothetical protein n=1 Tax=Acinetobacter sp. TGL-Y2 TaxID=1407071 RepID=UPI000A542B2C|nr:hypothetical protein [Acinetobacter sp. TGL-Y2]